MFRKEKKQLPYEYIQAWQDVLFANLGILPGTDEKTIRESCRKILLSTSRLYENLERNEAGLKPLEDIKNV